MAKSLKSSLSLDTVNEAIVDALIEGKSIGQRIRRLRLKRSMGLAELGREVGLSASFLSQLENGRVVVPCIADFESGIEGAAFHPQIFAGLELVYVINGPLTLSTEDKTGLLHTEDSAWIDGSTSRLYRCLEDKAARALIVTFALQS